MTHLAEVIFVDNNGRVLEQRVGEVMASVTGEGAVTISFLIRFDGDENEEYAYEKGSDGWFYEINDSQSRIAILVME